jgi:hypothetical protein
MKRKTILAIVIFFIVQVFVTGFCCKLPAEPIKTSESTFILTEDEPTVEYKVVTMKDLYHAQAQAVKERGNIYIVERVDDEVIEGMKLMNAEVVTFTYENVDVYFYDGRSTFIVHE